MSETRRSQTTDRATRRRLLIVGCGMVAHRLCRRLVASHAIARFETTVIGEEPHPAYDRIRLSETPTPRIDAILLADRAFYDEAGIALVTGERVTAIDREATSARLESGRCLDYDVLVLATGSEPLVPPIEGIDAPAVQVFRSYDDLARLRERAQRGRVAAIIGGGLLGLETAKVLVDAGMTVHVIEASSHLMPRQLDGESAATLDAKIRALGVETHLARYTRQIETLEHGVRLHFEGAEPALDADFVVVAAGIKPRDELARAAELNVAARGGVIVDDRLQTSDPAIYAVGECVSHRGERIGLVAPGYEMADVLADNLAGARRRFRGADQSCQLKLMGVPVFATGLYDREASLLGVDVEDGRRTLMLDGNRLVGVTAVGSWPNVVRAQDAARRERRLSKRQLERFQREGELWPSDGAGAVESWPEATVICNCVAVTRGQLSACVARGCRDVSSLGEATGAGTTCGSCTPLLAQLCGTTAPRVSERGRLLLAGSSIAALALALGSLVLEPVPFAKSVQWTLHEIDRLWRDSEVKQWSGYTLLAVTAIGGLLSLRKRVSWFTLGSFGAYRGIHGLVGALSLLALGVHTGMRFGDNLNLMLMSVFTAACVIGAVTGVISTLETTPGGRAALRARVLRRPATWLHILLFWPLPVLVGLHVFSVYYF